MSGWDKLILNRVLLKNLLSKMKEMLAGLSIPVPSFSAFEVRGIEKRPLRIKKFDVRIPELAQPQIAIQDGRLVLASCLKSGGAVDISDFPWPPEPFFILLSRAVVRHFTQLVTENLSLQDQGEKLTASWSFSIRLGKLDIGQKEAPAGHLRLKASLSFEAKAKLSEHCPIATATGTL
jgi:hypothetical protein